MTYEILQHILHIYERTTISKEYRILETVLGKLL